MITHLAVKLIWKFMNSIALQLGEYRICCSSVETTLEANSRTIRKDKADAMNYRRVELLCNVMKRLLRSLTHPKKSGPSKESRSLSCRSNVEFATRGGSILTRTHRRRLEMLVDHGTRQTSLFRSMKLELVYNASFVIVLCNL